jgi:hypothetical protein
MSLKIRWGSSACNGGMVGEESRRIAHTSDLFKLRAATSRPPPHSWQLYVIYLLLFQSKAHVGQLILRLALLVDKNMFEIPQKGNFSLVRIIFSQIYMNMCRCTNLNRNLNSDTFNLVVERYHGYRRAHNSRQQRVCSLEIIFYRHL